MSTITKEWLQQKIAEMEATRDEIPFGLDEDDSNTLAALRIALASIEAEAVAYMWDSDRKDVDAAGYYRPEHKIFAESSVKRYGGKVVALFAAPPAPASVPDYPETLPCPVILEAGLRFGKGVPTRTMLGALQRRTEYYAELEAMTPEQRAEHDAGMKKFAAMLQGGQ